MNGTTRKDDSVFNFSAESEKRIGAEKAGSITGGEMSFFIPEEAWCPPTDVTERRQLEESSMTANSAWRSSVTDITGKKRARAQTRAMKEHEASCLLAERRPTPLRHHQARLASAIASHAKLRKSSISGSRTLK